MSLGPSIWALDPRSPLPAPILAWTYEQRGKHECTSIHVRARICTHTHTIRIHRFLHLCPGSSREKNEKKSIKYACVVKMVQQVKVLVGKPDDLRSIPNTPKLSSDLHVHVVECLPPIKRFVYFYKWSDEPWTLLGQPTTPDRFTRMQK